MKREHLFLILENGEKPLIIVEDVMTMWVVLKPKGVHLDRALWQLFREFKTWRTSIDMIGRDRIYEVRKIRYLTYDDIHPRDW